MIENIETIQSKILKSIEKLDSESENVAQEVARANSIASLSNTYIKSCNLIIRVEEAKNKEKIKNIMEKTNEK